MYLDVLIFRGIQIIPSHWPFSFGYRAQRPLYKGPKHSILYMIDFILSAISILF